MSDSEQLRMDRAWEKMLSILLRIIGLDEMWDGLSEQDRRAQVGQLRHDFANAITPAMPANWRLSGAANGFIQKPKAEAEDDTEHATGAQSVSDSRS